MMTKTSKNLDPPGFSLQQATPVQGSNSTRLSSLDRNKASADTTLRLKKAWDQSLAPAKSLPMNLFMMWMSGNSVQIFNLVITVMMFFQPVKALMGVQSVFERFESPEKSASRKDISLLLPKIVFCLINILSIGLGLWKCSKMGLLPTTTSDWLAFEHPRKMLETALF
ncbi:hypothetical protein H4R33_001126 [Dimargaris cristalligena]|nr:hypothetical protein H4R33_001126 [Dimargaris cristalligena]